MKKNSFRSDCVRIDFTFKHQYFILFSAFFLQLLHPDLFNLHVPHLFCYSMLVDSVAGGVCSVLAVLKCFYSSARSLKTFNSFLLTLSRVLFVLHSIETETIRDSVKDY